jgi:hypothetical protein
MVKEQRSSTSPITGSCRLLSVSCVLGYRLGESEEYRPDSWQVCLNHATGRRCSTSPPPLLALSGPWNLLSQIGS